jgi:hypothetical protein
MPLTYKLSGTLLQIDEIDFSDYAVRELTMTLAPIVTGNELVRNVDGGLMDWSSPQFQKFQSTITCADLDPPAFMDIWPGKIVHVRCVPGLMESSSGGSTAGLLDTDGTLSLIMMVSAWTSSRDDWGAMTSWQLDLKEV